MANISAISVTVNGPADKLEAFHADFVREIAPFTETGTEPVLSVVEEPSSQENLYDLSMRGKPDFSVFEAVSSKYSDVVITVAGVELANGYAQAAVIRNGVTVGEYSMDDTELYDTAGPEGDEEAVFEELFSTVEAYRADALAAITSSPFPGRVLP